MTRQSQTGRDEPSSDAVYSILFGDAPSAKSAANVPTYSSIPALPLRARNDGAVRRLTGGAADRGASGSSVAPIQSAIVSIAGQLDGSTDECGTSVGSGSGVGIRCLGEIGVGPGAHAGRLCCVDTIASRHARCGAAGDLDTVDAALAFVARPRQL